MGTPYQGAPWVKLYTADFTRPEWVKLGDRAKVVLVQATMYAGAHATDGLIPAGAFRYIGLTAKADSELVAQGWWFREGDDRRLADWSVRQLSRAQLRANREREAAKKRRGRGRSDDLSPGDAPGDSPGLEVEVDVDVEELPAPRAVSVDHSGEASAGRTASERGSRPRGNPRRPSDLVARFADGSGDRP